MIEDKLTAESSMIYNNFDVVREKYFVEQKSVTELIIKLNLQSVIITQLKNFSIEVLEEIFKTVEDLDPSVMEDAILHIPNQK